MQSWSDVSLWMEQALNTPHASSARVPRPSLDKDTQYDIGIIGAGYTGLWSAYYLKKQNPDLSIAIVESQTAGYGASGRNGGWLMGELAEQNSLLKNLTPAEKKNAHNLIHDIPNEVERVINKESIECGYKKSGVLYVSARYPEQNQLLQNLYKDAQNHHYESEDFQWLNETETKKRINIPSAQAAVFSPHCARVQPAMLARGLARTVEAMGVSIYENSPVTEWKKNEIITAHGCIKCDWVVPAVEAYGSSVKNPFINLKRIHLPVQSMIIATEPLSDDIWDNIGLHNGEVFSDMSRHITYGQRTADNRMVFGTRGGYLFNGKTRSHFKLTDEEVQLRKTILTELFPILSDAKITHSWGGNLSLSRQFSPHVVKDESQNFVLAGGYGGEGVGATNLAGRTVASLILNQNNALTNLPWVKDSLTSVKKWEYEPLPYLGSSMVNAALTWEDNVLKDSNSPTWKKKLSIGLADLAETILN